MQLAASTQRTIGFVILAIVVFGGLLYIFFNIASSKAGVGSEIELAPNRRPGVPDDELEGRKLDLALGANLVMLTIIGISLPVYWLGEPGRQEGRDVDTLRIFTNRGEEQFVERCQSCHGPEGAGSSLSTAITNDAGEFIAQVNWKAPALNTVMSRFSEDEILETLNFGRNGIMPAWGAPGGGPLTEQQLEEIVAYLRSIQIPEDRIREQVSAGLTQRVREMFLAGDADYAVAIRDAREVADEAQAAVEAAEDDDRDFSCSDEAHADDDRCGALADARAALGDDEAAAAGPLGTEAENWIADAQGVAETARMLAIEDDPSLDGDDLRFAALEILVDGDRLDPADWEMYKTYGEFLFSNPGTVGTFSCARCHTYGFSFDAAGEMTFEDNGRDTPIPGFENGYDQGGGFFGKPLRRESTRDQFESSQSHAEFVGSGQTIGATYGRGGSGGIGQMPGFGSRVESDAIGPGIDPDLETPYPALLTQDQIDAIVAFERNL